MRIAARDGKAVVELEAGATRGGEIELGCRFTGDFASALLEGVAVERPRLDILADRLANPGTEPCVLQSLRPGEFVLALTPVPDSEDVVVKATLTRLRELGRMRASDMLTLSFIIDGKELPRLAAAARELGRAS